MDLTGDGKLIKEIIKEGSGDSPKEGQLVEGILTLIDLISSSLHWNFA